VVVQQLLEVTPPKSHFNVMLRRGSGTKNFPLLGKMFLTVWLFWLIAQKQVFGGDPSRVGNVDAHPDRVSLYRECSPPLSGSIPAVSIPSVPTRSVSIQYVPTRLERKIKMRNEKNISKKLEKFFWTSIFLVTVFIKIQNKAPIDFRKECKLILKLVTHFYWFIVKVISVNKFFILEILFNLSSQFFGDFWALLVTFLVFSLWLKMMLLNSKKPKCKIPKIFVRIKFLQKSNHVLHRKRIYFSVNGELSYWRLLKLIRLYGQIDTTTELYLATATTMISTGTIWREGKLKLFCCSDSTFGGDKSDDENGNDDTRHDKNNGDVISARRTSDVKKGTVTALYSNTNGLGMNKIEALRQEGRDDAFIMGTEWNRKSCDTSMVANYFGKFALLKSCHNFTYRKGVRIPLECKKKGYGTGIVAKENNTLKEYDNLSDLDGLSFEVLPSLLKLS